MKRHPPGCAELMRNGDTAHQIIERRFLYCFSHHLPVWTIGKKQALSAYRLPIPSIPRLWYDSSPQLPQPRFSVFPFGRKISLLIAAAAIFNGRIIQHAATHGEACHWILSRLRPLTARLSATHNNLHVAALLRYGCHRLTMICASLTLLQIMFAGATCVRCCDSSSLTTGRNDAADGAAKRRRFIISAPPPLFPISKS